MRKIIYLLFAVTFTLFCSTAFSQSTKIYIKALDNNGIILNGGSIDVGHVNQIEPLSYSQGVTNACSTCIPQISDFSFLMALNAASVQAKQMLLKGLHLMSVDVSFHKSAATFDYYKMHMEDVTIESVQESGSSEVPTIAVSWLPAKIAWQFTAQKSDGSIGTRTKGGWDFTTNTEYNYY